MTFKKLENMSKLNIGLSNYDDRLNHLTNIEKMNELEICEHKIHSSKTTAESNPFNIIIEQWGTYLLRSKDKISSREGDYSFFETESEYRKRAVGRNSISTVFGDGDGEFQLLDDEDSNSRDYDFYCEKMKSLKNMEPESIANLIRKYHHLKDEFDYINKDLVDSVNHVISLVLDELNDDKDTMIVELILSGKTESEIADLMGIRRQNVNKRFLRICNKKLQS